MEQDITEQLRIRAAIRLNAMDRKSVQNNQVDRLAILLFKAAEEIDELRNKLKEYESISPQ